MEKILIVEDEEPINRLVKQNLALAGHVCEQVYDGEKAKQQLLSDRGYDLVIMDVMLPYIDGFSLMEYAKDIPVIFLTAKSQLADKLTGLTSSKEGQEEIVKWAEDSEMMDGLAAEGDAYGLSYDSANLSREEAGLIMLKEINRLFAEETLNQLSIESICMETSVWINEIPYISWIGRFTNGLDIVDPNYVSYDFEVDAVSGKIIRCQRFHSYQKGKDYSSISWTDEEILEQAGKWIETYDLTFGEELDWTNAELINVTEDVPSMMKELEEGSFTSLGNIVVFPKNGKWYFYISIDFETGRLESYLWPGTSASDEILM